MVTLLAMNQGGRKIICPPFEPHAMMKIYEKYKVTFSFLASPVAFKFTKENTSPYDTSSLETIIFAGGTLDAKQMEMCRSYFPNTSVSSGYGQTEACGFISSFEKPQYGELNKKKPSSCGVLRAALSAKIVDINIETTLGVGEKGEIRLGGKGLMNGYRNGDMSGVYDDDGFLKTGDLGYFDEDNCLYVCDRLKDMFKYQSWHIVPASLESVVYQHPAVQETVVIGVPDRVDGDHPMALVVLKPQYADVAAGEIKKFVDERVLDREKLRAGLKIVPDLPKTTTGKLLRRHVRQMVLNGEF